MEQMQEIQFPKETMLELVQLDGGEIVLRPVIKNAADKEAADMLGDEPLVSIQFSEKVKDMLGEDIQGVGQVMIHSALQMVMHQQMAKWHAHVVDEEPKFYS